MLLVVGEIVRPHGVRGEVLVHVRTDEPADRFAPGSVLITDPGASPAAPEGAWRPPATLTVESARLSAESPSSRLVGPRRRTRRPEAVMSKSSTCLDRLPQTSRRVPLVPAAAPGRS